VVTPQQILRAREVVSQIYLDEKVENYILDIVAATRTPGKFGLNKLTDLIRYGASPRASIYLARAARAQAFIRRRGYVTPEDIRSIGYEVLRHRVMPTFEAEADDITSDNIIRDIFDNIEVP
jgi:MoxR-like ATPase